MILWTPWKKIEKINQNKDLEKKRKERNKDKVEELQKKDGMAVSKNEAEKHRMFSFLGRHAFCTTSSGLCSNSHKSLNSECSLFKVGMPFHTLNTIQEINHFVKRKYMKWKNVEGKIRTKHHKLLKKKEGNQDKSDKIKNVKYFGS